jgi:branched-subunit amino acid transport protein AzlD
MSTDYVIAAIMVMTAITIGIRSVPFLLPQRLFSNRLVQNIARIMPLLIMVTLVAHAFQNATWSLGGTATPLILGVISTALMQYFVKVPLLSILVGLIIHVSLVNMA